MLAGLALIIGASALLLHNSRVDRRAGEAAAAVVQKLQTALPPEPGGQAAAGAEMPAVEIDGYTYIGVLDLPDGGPSLPVQAAWDEGGALVSPCRYQGSAYDGSLIVAGHNYKTGFGRLYGVAPGDAVRFTDMNGAVFEYVVSQLETVDQYDLAGMERGEWDMTLFSCTLDGRRRVAVRCVRVNG